MTLGGLALAVGILVDDATVTIENINWHLEQDKDIETAIMDGARQIVMPATVSLLCICIVFVPMFKLGGVAGYLFRPMAEAVVFALIASYVLSRTLVNTMARFLLAASGRTTSTAKLRRRPAIRSSLFQRGFERRFEAARAFYRRLLETALAARWAVHRRLSAGRRLFVRARPLPRRRTSFRRSPERAAQAPRARADRAPASRTRRRLCDGVEAAIRQIIPADALGPIVDNIGLPVSGINQTYNNSGTVGPADADILITVKPEYESEADGYVRKMRETSCRARFPGTTFAFLPADIVSQILNFGLPAPIDVQVVGTEFRRQPRLRRRTAEDGSRASRASPTRASSSRSTIRRSDVEVDRMRAGAGRA